MLIITFTVLLIWAIYNHKLLLKYIGELYSLISPFVIGLCIAYVVNVIMRPIERLWMKLLSKCKGKWVEKMKRPICLLLSILDRKSTRLNSSHPNPSRMPSSA